MLALAWPPVTPAIGPAGAMTIKREPATATTSGNDYKITKCGWSTKFVPAF